MYDYYILQLKPLQDLERSTPIKSIDLKFMSSYDKGYNPCFIDKYGYGNRITEDQIKLLHNKIRFICY